MAGLRPAVGDHAHPERRRVPVRGLPGVTDGEADVVQPQHRERVGGVVVGDLPDERVDQRVGHADQ